MATIEQGIRALQRLKQRIPYIAGAEAVQFAVENIRKERTADGVAMEPRKRNDRNPARRGLLIKTGFGQRSIQITRAFKGLVTISMVDYMQAHNEGAHINHPGGTDFFYDGEAVRYVSRRKANQLRAAGRRLRKTKPHVINLPARPFLKPGTLLNQRMVEAIIREFNRAL